MDKVINEGAKPPLASPQLRGWLYGDGTVVGKYGHNQPNRKALKRQKIEHNTVLFTFNTWLGWVAR